MICCGSFAAFEEFLLREGYVRVDETDSHDLFERGEGVVTVHKPNGNIITVMEVDSACEVAGLMPPDLDQFCGD